MKISERNLIDANIKLMDENKVLRRDNEILQTRMDNLKDLIKSTKGLYLDNIDEELLEILDGGISERNNK